MKIQITFITLIGLTCATIALGKETITLHGSQIDARALSERANQMSVGREQSMSQLMAQIENMQKQVTALHETLRRNHTRRNLVTVRNVKDAVDEINRNFRALNSQASRFISTKGVPSTLGTRSLGSDSQQ